VHLPKNNRYCYYHCNLGTQENEREERRITLHLQLNENKITFLKVFDIELKETNEKINGITFEVECSNSKVSLEKAFNDYQHLMKELLDFGCQNYFGLAEPRFKTLKRVSIFFIYHKTVCFGFLLFKCSSVLVFF